MRPAPQAARRRGLIVALGVALSACPEPERPAESSAECASRGACTKSGRCTLDPKSKKCVVGSDSDCARADICHVERRCRKVGSACGE